MSCARIDYLHCLNLFINTMCTNPVWLIFHRHNLILEKERKRDIRIPHSDIYGEVFLRN